MKKNLSGLVLLAVLFLTNCSKIDEGIQQDPDVKSVAANNTSNAIGAANIAGVNWADARDNFVDGWVIPSGLTSSDTYSSASSKANIVLAGFQNAGANTVRLPINAPSVLESWWGTYTGAIDRALSRGMKVILCYWEAESSRDGFVDNTTQFWSMWQTVVNKYGSNANVYFEVINEPHGYNLSGLTTLYAEWLNRYQSVPRGRIILGGTGYSQNVTGVGADSRFSNCLLAIHDYTWFGSSSYTTPAQWENHLQSNIGSYASRTILTEFGAPMTTGKNYNGFANGDVEIAYIQGMTNKCRNSGIASVYWPGLRDGDSYSLFTFNGSNMTLTNASGLDRLQYGWNQSGGGGSFDPNAYYRIVNRNSSDVLDVNGGVTTDGAPVIQWPWNSGNNQQWRIIDNGGGYYRIINRNSGDALDVNGGSSTDGTPVIQWPWNGGNNQQWQIVDNGGGYYRVINRNSGDALDVNGGSSTDGAAVIQWPWNGGANQQWQIIKL